MQGDYQNENQEDELNLNFFERNDSNNSNNFRISNSSLRRSVMTANDLTDETKLRKSISNFDINNLTEENYIKPENWDFIENEEQEKLLEENYKKFEEKFLSKKTKNLINLILTLKSRK